MGERTLSILAGGGLAAFGASRRSWAGVALIAAGGALIYRGISGRWMIGSAIRAGVPAQLRRTFTIPSKSPEEVYGIWRDLENLPRFVENLESVKAIDSRRSHWVAKGPAGKSIEWDAEITNDRPGRLIEWRSVPGSGLDLSGMVRFKRKQGRGTKVHLEMQYSTPGGAIGEAIAALLRQRPEERLDQGLSSFREALEHA
jgi:uncharacterized membrane protein